MLNQSLRVGRHKPQRGKQLMSHSVNCQLFSVSSCKPLSIVWTCHVYCTHKTRHYSPVQYLCSFQLLLLCKCVCSLCCVGHCLENNCCKLVGCVVCRNWSSHTMILESLTVTGRSLTLYKTLTLVVLWTAVELSHLTETTTTSQTGLTSVWTTMSHIGSVWSTESVTEVKRRQLSVTAMSTVIITDTMIETVVVAVTQTTSRPVITIDSQPAAVDLMTASDTDTVDTTASDDITHHCLLKFCTSTSYTVHYACGRPSHYACGPVIVCNLQVTPMWVRKRSWCIFSSL